jgi:uncharacterized protein (DUF2141 family)
MTKLFLGLISAIGFATSLNAATLLNVSGLDATGGNLQIAVDSSEASFEEKAPPAKLISVPVSSTAMQVDLGDLPAGTYAIRVFQDVNKNEELDTNLVGIPSEPFGFSNNPRITFGPPSFSQAAVEFKTGAEIHLQMKKF